MLVNDFLEEVGVLAIADSGKTADFSAESWENWFNQVQENFGVRYADNVRKTVKDDSETYYVPFTCPEFKILVEMAKEEGSIEKGQYEEMIFLSENTLRAYIEKFFD